MLKGSSRKRLAMSIISKIGVALVFGISAVFAILLSKFKVAYKVYLNNEETGYIANKDAMEAEINKYIQNGDAENVAYVEMDASIRYDMMLVKKDVDLKDKEIFTSVRDMCSVYYKAYAINIGEEEKYVVSSKEEAQAIVDGVNEKQKSFTKQVKVEIDEKIVSEAEYTTDIEVAVNDIIEPLKKENDVLVAMNLRYASTKTVSQEVLQALKENLQELNFEKPLEDGIITSQYGWRSTGYHYGLDIAAPVGVPIHVSEGGVVTFSGWSGSYGYIVKVQHTGGYETYYAHCSKLLVDVGDEIAKGDTIALVGSTGRSTGPHLHLEIRYNGQTLDPEAFVYQ